MAIDWPSKPQFPKGGDPYSYIWTRLSRALDQTDRRLLALEGAEPVTGSTTVTTTTSSFTPTALTATFLVSASDPGIANGYTLAGLGGVRLLADSSSKVIFISGSNDTVNPTGLTGTFLTNQVLLGGAGGRVSGSNDLTFDGTFLIGQGGNAKLRMDNAVGFKGQFVNGFVWADGAGGGFGVTSVNQIYFDTSKVHVTASTNLGNLVLRPAGNIDIGTKVVYGQTTQSQLQLNDSVGSQLRYLNGHSTVDAGGVSMGVLGSNNFYVDGTRSDITGTVAAGYLHLVAPGGYSFGTGSTPTATTGHLRIPGGSGSQSANVKNVGSTYPLYADWANMALNLSSSFHGWQVIPSAHMARVHQPVMVRSSVIDVKITGATMVVPSRPGYKLWVERILGRRRSVSGAGDEAQISFGTNQPNFDNVVSAFFLPNGSVDQITDIPIDGYIVDMANGADGLSINVLADSTFTTDTWDFYVSGILFQEV